MKKSIAIIITLFAIISVNAQIIEKTFYFSDYKIVDVGEYSIVRFNNTLTTGIVGEPALPYHSVSLLLPPGHVAEKVEFIGEDEIRIEGDFKLYPQQASRQLSKEKSGIFRIKNSVYNSFSQYPVKQSGEFSTEFLNGYSFVLSSFTPVKYTPREGKIDFYKKVTIRVTTKPDIKAETALKNLAKGDFVNSKIESYAQNPEMVSVYPKIKSSSEDDYQMMIITPALFENNYEDLINLYISRGIIAKVITTEDINTNIAGQDLQEKIRNYIIQEYQGHGVQYILLGGDVEHVPYRGFYCAVQSGEETYESSNIPADVYYSALDGNWNNDGDDKWGEPGEDDLLPDVSVARFPVSNAEELENMIHKSVYYQNQPVLGELEQPLFVGEFATDNPLTWGSDYLDLLIGNHTDNGYETTGIPESNNYDTLYDRTSHWEKSQLLSKINEGTSFIYHVGHAFSGSVMRLEYPDIINSNFSQVNGTDHNFTLVYSHGCDCGAFDFDDCIAEKIVNIDNFAAGGIFNSRYGWFNEGQTEGPSEHLNREFVDALYSQKKTRMGEAHKISKIESSAWVTATGQHEEGALRWCFYSCNYLGDPAMSVWTTEPINIDVTYENSFAQNAGSTSVNVKSNGVPVENFTCVLKKDNTIYGTAKTDNNGNAQIQFAETAAEQGPAQIVVSGSNCLPHSYDVTISSTSSVGNISINSGITVFPNPASHILNINIPENSEISIFNILGKEVKALKAKKGLLTVDINGLPTGQYFVKATFDRGILIKKVIIK